MSPERQRTTPHDERATAAAVRHSAFEEFRRDERRPAVLLLGALVIAALFFAIGIMLGRWMADDQNASGRRPPQAVNGSSNAPDAPSRRP
ncbi:MAG TPA: hypothetical protein VF527_05905 [Pyrinomonadaceae bacterium]|jgi:Tfp pilus assembly protein PilN